MAKKITPLLALILLAGCTQVPSLYKNSYVISGTFVEVTSPHPDAGQIVHEEFKRLDKIFNAYNPRSEVARLNRVYAETLPISQELVEVLQFSRTLNYFSKGAFDVSCGRLYNFWKGFMDGGDIPEFPSPSQVENLRSASGIEAIEVDASLGAAKRVSHGVQLDLGSIAKGYMVDKAVERLKQEGISDALINAGGDIYCLGKDQGEPWDVGVKHPKSAGAVLRQEPLSDAAIATSGNYQQFFQYQGKRFSHLIDPRSGYPVANGIVSVSVISKNCMMADALSTTLFVMGLSEIPQFVLKNRSIQKVIVVTEEKGSLQVHTF